MKSLIRKIKEIAAKELGCDDCTMLESWCLTTAQRPEFCKHDERFIFCPVTGKMPGNWQNAYDTFKYMFIDDESEES